MAEVSCTTPAERETRGGLKAARRTRQLFSSAANGTELCCSGVRALPPAASHHCSERHRAQVDGDGPLRAAR